MAGFTDKVSVEIDIGVNAQQAKTRVEEVQRLIKGMSGDQAKIVLDANISELQSKLKAAKQEITSLSDEDVKLQIEVIGEGEKQLRELKELADKVDAEKVTIDVDTTKVDEVKGKLAGAKQGIDDVGKSADGSKSVLANMIGNTTQDLGALGGVAGSTGVAIGQMGEYFADATLAGEGFGSAMKSFALVAGPVAALAVATAVLPVVLEALSTEAAVSREEVKKLADAMSDSATESDAWVENLREVVTTNDDLEAAMVHFGVTIGDLNRAIINQGVVLGAGREQAANMVQEFEVLRDTENGSVAAVQKMADVRGITVGAMYEQLGAAQALVGVTEEETAKYKEANRELEVRRAILSDLTTNIDTATQATIDQGLADEKLGDNYKLLVEARKRGLPIQDMSIDAIKREIDSYDSAQESIDAQIEGMTDLRVGLEEIATTYDKAAGAAQGFTSVMGSQREKMFGIHQTAADVEEGIGGLVDQLSKAPQAFKDTGSHITTFSQTGRDLLDTLEQENQKLGENFSTILKGGGSYDDVRNKATNYRQELVAQFDQLGLTSDEQQNYLEFLGLTPEQVETTIKLSKADEARQKIALLNVDINALPAEARTEYIAAIDKGDYEAAHAALHKLADPENKIVTVDANTADAEEDLRRTKLLYDALRDKTVKVTTISKFEAQAIAEGGEALGGLSLVGERGPEIVVLPKGAYVYTAAETRLLRGYADGGIVGPITGGAGALRQGAPIELLYQGPRYGVSTSSSVGTSAGSNPIYHDEFGNTSWTVPVTQATVPRPKWAPFQPPTSAADLQTPGGRSPGTNITLIVNAGLGADGTHIGREIVNTLVQYNRSIGPLPVTVR